MKERTLAERRERVLRKIAAGRLDVIDALEVVLEPVRKIDRLRAAFDRGVKRSRSAAPMMMPLVPVGVLALVRGRRLFGSVLMGALRLSLRSAGFLRLARQVAPLLAAASHHRGAHAGPP
ncbi:hypothetical protein [Pararobbsia alpina]|uniref:Uncharacterized protein n=1 Tax=Pararobbsia alpina TaxID=621374 RepID=A0A6S7B6R5_9BURK|nr:hypothetical protein [Pararobbsia alpina]CAB3781663.1 hypothetical protein LMG28138_01275 [Pararobbsia alpina]